MSRKATEFQKKEMSKMYRGKEIFKPLPIVHIFSIFLYINKVN